MAWSIFNSPLVNHCLRMSLPKEIFEILAGNGWRREFRDILTNETGSNRSLGMIFPGRGREPLPLTVLVVAGHKWESRSHWGPYSWKSHRF